MEKRTWAKFIIAGLLTAAIAVGLYLRWTPVRQSSNPLARWGRGNMTFAESSYYISRIDRIIDNWRQTHGHADFDKDGRFTESYRTLLVIDLEKQAIWIEEDGQIQKNNYAEFPAGMKWKLHHVTPQGSKELTSRIVLKKRGFNSRQQTPETFYLIGTGRGPGRMHFHFTSSGGGGSYNSGTFHLELYSSSRKIENPYGSILVTDAEYEKYRTSTNPTQPNGENYLVKADNPFKENMINWLKSEKFMYCEIEKQLLYTGFELSMVTLEPGPDYSAAHAEVRGSNRSFLREILDRPSSVEVYLKIDYLGNDIWYAKSAVNPRRPIPTRRKLDCEFLICSKDDVPNSTQKEFIEKGRQKQQQDEFIPESKWKAVFSNGATVEFIGICENPSAGKQWWGPDGSSLDYVPYINTEPYGRTREDRKIYEFAWRTTSPPGSNAVTYSLEGSAGSYYRQIHDRYGNRVIEGISANGYGFDKTQQKTTLKFGLTTKNWQTALSIKDKAGEIKFLDKQRIILNPPKIEDGKIVVRCYEQYHEQVEGYQTEFALVIREGPATNTVSLGRYEKDVSDNRDTGLREHKFIIEEMPGMYLDMHQIAGVCFRHRPYEFVRFKNITLIPGKNQGFEIVLGE